MPDIDCDVLIIGASLGGVAAALSAGARGSSVQLIEPSNWVGGQMTAQGVCTPDDNQYVETTGSTRAYRDFRHRVREHYRTTYELSQAGGSMPLFNAGSCWVNSGFSVEPLVAQQIMLDMLAESGNVMLHLSTAVTAVAMNGDAIASVTATSADGTAYTFHAPMVLDATDLGDLLPFVGAEYVVGAESRAQTLEPDAPAAAHPEWMQPLTFPFALERMPAGEDHTIPKPDGYDQWKALQGYKIADGSIQGVFSGNLSWWTYRRVIAARNFADPHFPNDIATINTGSNDFKGASVPSGSSTVDAHTLEQARLASLGYVYWLQTECPRDENPQQLGYPELRLRFDIFGTDDGLSPSPYIRESRRIIAKRTVTELDIAAKYQTGPRAALFADSCGVGSYAMDVHAGMGEDGLWEPTRPFQIPLGSLVPTRITNLIPACKNIGMTHLTNGAYRVHPSEWAIGEAAGALGAACAGAAIAPNDVLTDAARLLALQKSLVASGAPVFWWSDVDSSHPAFAATQLLAVQGIFQGNGQNLSFDAASPLTATARDAVSTRIGEELPWPGGPLTRADGAIWLANHLGLV